MEHLLTDEEYDRYKGMIPVTSWLGFHDAGDHPAVKFPDYPTERGWSSEELTTLMSGRFPEHKPVEASLTMLQSWLMFGFLEASFETKVPAAPFVFKAQDGRYVVRTTHLKHFLDIRNAMHKNTDDEILRRHVKHSFNCMNEFHAVYWTFYQHDLKRTFPELCKNVGFHLVMRLAVLVADTIHWSNVYVGSRLSMWMSDLNLYHTSFNRSELSEKLGIKGRGWCPSIKTQFESYGLSFSEYVGLLEATDSDHNQHVGCVPNKRCQRPPIDESAYVTQHTSKPCICESEGFFKVPKKDVYDILENGGIPLIDVDPKHPVVVEWKEGLTYVAFSHVWTDGLGSCTEYGLPPCQIDALKRLAFRIGGCSYIWIDAMCIPADQAQKRKALNTMNRVYRSSSKTVILDSSLKQLSFKKCSSIPELVVRILTCKWMQRLWTLSECLLSQSPVLVLQDGDYTLEQLLAPLKDTCYPIEYRGFAEIVRLLSFPQGKAPTIGTLQRLLSHRNTSNPEDEPIAIAAIYNQPIATLTAKDQSTAEIRDQRERRVAIQRDRMAQFWITLERVPSNTIFLQCRRLQEKGLSWAPQSLIGLSIRGAQMDTAIPNAIITKEGLQATYFTFTFQTRRSIDKTSFDLWDTEKSLYYGATLIKPEDGWQGEFYCDAVASFSRPTQSSKRGLAVAFLSDGDAGLGLPKYKFMHSLFLDHEPRSDVSAPIRKQLASNCVGGDVEMVVA